MKAGRPDAAIGGEADLLWLSALLAGLGRDARGAADALAAHAAAGSRMCVDAGAALLLAVRAPGARGWEAHVAAGTENGASRWTGVRIGEDGAQIAMQRVMFRHHDPDAPARAAALAQGESGRARLAEMQAQLGPWGRIYAIGQAPEDRGAARVAWQLDRHAPVAEIASALVGEAGWRAARASLSQVLGFDLAATSGPWSVSVSLAAPEAGVRLGTTRWAWAIEDSAKRDRLARWIAAHGGDGAHAAALYDLAAGARRTSPTMGRRIGRAVEIDVIDARVTGAIAYLGADLIRAPMPGETGATKEQLPWAG